MRVSADTKIVVPLKGAAVDLSMADTGEVVASLPLSGGIHSGRDLLPYQTEGMEFKFPSTISVIEPPTRVVIVQNDEHLSSAVRDGYKPSEATLASQALAGMLRRQEARLRRLMKEQMASGGRQAAREARLEAETIEDEPDLIEDATDAPDASKAAG